MIKNANSFSKLLLCLLVAAFLSACGAKKLAPEEATTANTKDITRPPTVVKTQAPVESESNPDETISYDEWRRRREAEKAESQSTSSPDE